MEHEHNYYAKQKCKDPIWTTLDKTLSIDMTDAQKKKILIETDGLTEEENIGFTCVNGELKRAIRKLRVVFDYEVIG